MCSVFCGVAVPIPTWPLAVTRNFSVLPVLITTGLASVVPIKLVAGFVPAFPVKLRSLMKDWIHLYKKDYHWYSSAAKPLQAVACCHSFKTNSTIGVGWAAGDATQPKLPPELSTALWILFVLKRRSSVFVVPRKFAALAVLPAVSQELPAMLAAVFQEGCRCYPW